MIPLLIISRNRRSTIENVVKFAGQTENIQIHILDMNSSFPPLLEYYNILDTKKVYVHYMDNLGPRKIWISNVFKKITAESNGFFLSDGDIDYSETDPRIFQYFMSISSKFPGLRKIGSALRIDDLPENTIKSKNIIDSESPNWDPRRLIRKNIYLAPLDTQFAYYPKYTKEFYLDTFIVINYNIYNF
jgi:hypothetical protein